MHRSNFAMKINCLYLKSQTRLEMKLNPFQLINKGLIEFHILNLIIVLLCIEYLPYPKCPTTPKLKEKVSSRCKQQKANHHIKYPNRTSYSKHKHNKKIKLRKIHQIIRIRNASWWQKMKMANFWKWCKTLGRAHNWYIMYKIVIELISIDQLSIIP